MTCRSHCCCGRRQYTTQPAKLTLGRVVVFGLVGAVAVWFSHPATFVLAGMGMSLVLFCRAEDRWERARKLSITFSMWGLSLGVCYLLFLRHLSADQGLLSYWNFSFPPSHLFFVAAVEWFAATFFAILSGSGSSWRLAKVKPATTRRNYFSTSWTKKEPHSITSKESGRQCTSMISTVLGTGPDPEEDEFDSQVVLGTITARFRSGRDVGQEAIA